MMLPTINKFCRWLCFGKIKNVFGCYIGFFIALPFALSFAIIFGLNLGGGWTANALNILFDLNSIFDNKDLYTLRVILVFIILLGSIIGFSLASILILAIGANIGNFIGEVVSKVISRK